MMAAFHANAKRKRKHRVIIDCTCVYVCKLDDVVNNGFKANIIYIDLKEEKQRVL